MGMWSSNKTYLYYCFTIVLGFSTSNGVHLCTILLMHEPNRSRIIQELFLWMMWIFLWTLFLTSYVFFEPILTSPGFQFSFINYFANTKQSNVFFEATIRTLSWCRTSRSLLTLQSQELLPIDASTSANVLKTGITLDKIFSASNFHSTLMVLHWIYWTFQALMCFTACFTSSTQRSWHVILPTTQDVLFYIIFQLLQIMATFLEERKQAEPQVLYVNANNLLEFRFIKSIYLSSLE